MQDRRRLGQLDPIDKRLSEEAERLRKEARGTPPGVERDKLLRMARLAEAATSTGKWLSSPSRKVTT